MRGTHGNQPTALSKMYCEDKYGHDKFKSPLQHKQPQMNDGTEIDHRKKLLNNLNVNHSDNEYEEGQAINILKNRNLYGVDIPDTLNKQRVNGVVQQMERIENLTTEKRVQDKATVAESNIRQPETHFNRGKRVENLGRCEMQQEKRSKCKESNDTKTN